MTKGAKDEVTPSQRSELGNASINGVTHGYRSLARENAGESPFLGTLRDPGLSSVPVVNPPSNLCVNCSLAADEDCVRLSTYQRWHLHCVSCKSCGKQAASPAATIAEEEEAGDGSWAPGITTVRQPLANTYFFAYKLDSIVEMQSFGPAPTVIFCTDHTHQGCCAGFQAVSRLEQYAFLFEFCFATA
jgi:hypothetical protein